jgi:hypothetical protein
MTTLVGVDEQDLRAIFPQPPAELAAVLGLVLNFAVRDLQVLSGGEAHDLRRLGGFLGPPLGRAARTELTPREVDDPDLVPAAGEGAHDAAAAELYVVRMGSGGEDVESGSGSGCGCVGHGSEDSFQSGLTVRYHLGT